MKENILEQIVSDWLLTKGYFVQNNVKYRPSQGKGYNNQKHSVHSDIDVLGINPTKAGSDRVIAVSCKGYIEGVGLKGLLNLLESKPNKKVGNKEVWKHFRELVEPNWSKAFVSAVKSATGTNDFTHVTAIVTIKGKMEAREGMKNEWENNKRFKMAMNGNPIKLYTLNDIVSDMKMSLPKKTLASSDFGRTIQLLMSAEYPF